MTIETLFQSTPSAWRETFFRTVDHRLIVFQSTPSAWRETVLPDSRSPPHRISIHSLRMEGDRTAGSCTAGIGISIHSLRMEGDGILRCLLQPVLHFNPLPPHGGRLNERLYISPTTSISIHSLRMEGDLGAAPAGDGHSHFNPLPPHGGRRKEVFATMAIEDYFNPLPPHGGRPVGGTLVLGVQDFNPLPPHGGRPPGRSAILQSEVFQSTPSAWRETRSSSPRWWTFSHFNPLPPHGGRLNT